MTMGETGSVQLDLYTATGAKYTAEQDIVIPIEIAEGSTAVENTNFTFEGLNNWLSLRVKVQVPLPLKPARWKPEKTRSF